MAWKEKTEKQNMWFIFFVFWFFDSVCFLKFKRGILTLFVSAICKQILRKQTDLQK